MTLLAQRAPEDTRRPVTARLTAGVRRVGTDSLYRNSVMLMANTAASTVVGALFWLVAARRYAASDVGLLSATLSAAVLLGTASCLGLPNAVVRYLPRRVADSGALAATSVAVAAAAGLGVAALAVLTPWTMPLSRHDGSVALVGLGLAIVSMATAGMVLDSIAIARRAAHLLVVKNVAGGVVKLAVLLLLPVHGILDLAVAHVAGMLVSTVVNVVMMSKRLDGPLRVHPRSLKGVWTFSIGNHAGMIFGILPTTATPLVVLAALGERQAAFFGVALMLLGLVNVVPSTMSTSLFAELSTTPEVRRAHILRALRALYLLMTPCVVFIEVTAPWLLRAFGHSYEHGGAGALRWMALGALVAALNYVIDVSVNSLGKAAGYLYLNVANAVLVLGLVAVAAPHGLTAVGFAWFAAQSLSVLTAMGYLAVLRHRVPRTPTDAVDQVVDVTDAGAAARTSTRRAEPDAPDAPDAAATSPRVDRRLPFLDGLRGLAAAFVVVSHSWSTIYPHARGHLSLTQKLTAWMGLGHYAVSLFIVISGFSLGLVAWRHDLRWPGGMRAFFVGRFRRIVPAYWAAIAVGAGLGLTLLSRKVGTLWDGAVPIRAQGVGVHALLLQDLVWRGPAGSTAFWSLAVEWHIYCLFPLLILLVRRRPSLWVLPVLLFGALAAVAGSGMGHSVLAHVAGTHPSLYALFVLGFMAARCSARTDGTRRLRERTMIGFAAAGAVVVAVGFRHFDPVSPVNDLWFGPLAALAVGRLATGSWARVRAVLSLRPVVWVGLCSYSLYLIHSAVIEAVFRAAVRPFAMPEPLRLLVEVVLGLAASIAAAGAFHRLVEKRFMSRRGQVPTTATETAADQVVTTDRVVASEPSAAVPASAADVSPSRRHLPALDGLRALAIGGVLVGHAGVARLTGGNQGVTVFFVISGFLISSLLLAEVQRTGGLRFRAFYRRRFARLLPVLVVALVVTSATLLLLGHPLAGFWLGPVTALTYTTNLVVSAGGMTPPHLDYVWFGHTWSLAIEEQFYLVWPAVLWWAARRRRGATLLLVVTGALTLLPLVERNVLAHTGAGFLRVSRGTDTRVDALMLGCFLAVALQHPKVAALARRWGRALGWVGLLALTVVLFQTSLVRLDPGGYSSAAGAGALVLVAAVADDRRLPGRLLTWRPLRRVGELSYSLYLWNVLLLELFVRVFHTVPASTPWGLAWLVSLGLVAEASYRFVEAPLRRRFREPPARLRPPQQAVDAEPPRAVVGATGHR